MKTTIDKEKLDSLIEENTNVKPEDFNEIEINEISIGDLIEIKGVKLSLPATVLVAIVISFIGYLIYG